MRLRKLRNSVIIGVLMLLCFAAGAYATDGVKEVKAFLRGDFTILLDGRTINMKNSVLIYEGSSYLPLRETGHVLNVGVGWNEKDRTVILTSPPAAVSPTPTPTPTPTPAQPNTSPSNVTYPSEVKFNNLINYKITIDNQAYYVVANEVNSMIYFRQSDVLKMNLDLSGLKTVKESYTSELYYPASELNLRLKNPGKFEVSNEIITDETNAEKLKALKPYFPNNSSVSQAFYMRQLPGGSEYEILFRSSDKRFYFLTLKLVAQSNGTYYASSPSVKYLYN